MTRVAAALLVLGILGQGPNGEQELGEGAPPERVIAAADRLQDGDVLFRRGVGARALSVAALQRDSVFTHVGIVSRRHGKAWVVHAVPAEARGEHDATKAEPLDVFLAPARASLAAVYRVRLESAPRPAASEAARIASDYARVAIPFNGDFDLDSPNSLYCTELVVRAYQQSGVDLDVPTTDLHWMGRHWRVLLPRDLLHSGRLYRVL